MRATVAFKDVLGFLYQRAKDSDPLLKNQDDFAQRHGVKRETMNQWLTGNLVPPARAIWNILEREGYQLHDCIELPDAHEARAAHPQLFRDLEAIVLSGDEDRIRGITINLSDIAAGAKKAKSRQQQGNLDHRERKRSGKRRVS